MCGHSGIKGLFCSVLSSSAVAESLFDLFSDPFRSLYYACVCVCVPFADAGAGAAGDGSGPAGRERRETGWRSAALPFRLQLF